MFMPFAYWYDPTWLILIPAVILAIYAQVRVSSTFNRYSQIMSERGFTAAEVASHMLRHHGLGDVPVEMAQGRLTDHYDPKKRVLRLSQSTFSSSSVAALGVAAHEVGHAIQHQQGYTPMKVRTALVPLANIGTYAAFPLLILGLILQLVGLVYVGIGVFALAVLFQLVTLPVEYDASRRARTLLQDGGYLTVQETADARKVLSAAALTYLAATLMSLLQLLRFILLAGAMGRRRD